MKYIKGFDALRAISILLVILTHIGFYANLPDNSFIKSYNTLFSGATGVMIFFTISGFLITTILLNEKSDKGVINLKKFFIRRFLRLFPPLILFFTVITILMFFHHISRSYKALLISFFYLYNFVPRDYYVSELGHTWSLGVEEQFYFFWPFVLCRIKQMRNGFIVPLVIIILCIIWKLIYPMSIPINGKESYLDDYFFVARWFIPACLPIMVGTITSIVLFNNKDFFQSKMYRSYWLLSVAFLFFLAELYIPRFLIDFVNILQSIGISLLILWIYFNQNSLIVNMLEFKPISFLGKISYGVYVYQGLFLRTGPGGKLTIQQFPLNICLVFITAILSYFLYEKNILKFKEKFQ